MHLVGSSAARSIDITANGDITDGTFASIDVENHIGIEALNVYLGDTGTDFVRSGSLYFWSQGDMNINSDDDIRVVEEKNYAGALELIAVGHNITDSEEAVWEVVNLARFESMNVNIGDSTIDEFYAGSIEFNVENRFEMVENDDTLLTNDSTAGEAVIRSFGDVTNTENASVDVTMGAAFFGTNITLGIEAGDDMRFGVLNVRSPGRATVVENNDTVFGGENLVDVLQITSNGTISDGLNATIGVTRFATFKGSAITIGDNVDNEFNANAVTFDSTGDVFLNENSGMFLAGTNNAVNLELMANGELVSGDTARITATGDLQVAAMSISLGDSTNDLLLAGSVQFNADDDVTIHTDDSMNLVESSSADTLNLRAEGDLTDDDLAEIVVQGLAEFEATGDIMLGDSATDCLEYGSMVSSAGGTDSVQPGC